GAAAPAGGRAGAGGGGGGRAVGPGPVAGPFRLRGGPMRDVSLVTGATGFIGGYVVRHLVADGVPTRVLVRRPELLPSEVRGQVEVVQGDVRDRAALVAAVRGADTVLHLAACARAWSRDPTEFATVNVQG